MQAVLDLANLLPSVSCTQSFPNAPERLRMGFELMVPPLPIRQGEISGSAAGNPGIYHRVKPTNQLSDASHGQQMFLQFFFLPASYTQGCASWVQDFGQKKAKVKWTLTNELLKDACRKLRKYSSPGVHGIRMETPAVGREGESGWCQNNKPRHGLQWHCRHLSFQLALQ